MINALVDARDRTMPDVFDRAASITWWAGALSLALGLGASSGGLGAQQCLPHNPAGLADAEDALRPAVRDPAIGLDDPLARIEALEADRDRLVAALRRASEKALTRDEASPQLRWLADALINQRRENFRLHSDLAEGQVERRGLAEALIKQRRESVRLYSDLAEAKADCVRIEEAVGTKEVQSVVAECARAYRQVATITDQLRESDRELDQMAAVRSENADLRQRLDAAQTELDQKGTENARLAEQLAALRMAAAFATVMAQENLAAIEDQIAVHQAAAASVRPEHQAGYFTFDKSESPSGPAAATAKLAEVLPPMPNLKPRFPQGEVAASMAVSDMDGGGPAAAKTLATIEDGGASADLFEAAVSEWEPTTVGGLAVALDGSEDMDNMPAAALGEAAGRLVDGLKATRAEAVSDGQERVFTIDVAERAFAAGSAQEVVQLDPALDIELLTARSELVSQDKGRIRFFPNGSSTGGRIDLELLGEHAAVNVRWSNGSVTVER
jgi:general secretion pathway protein H